MGSTVRQAMWNEIAKPFKVIGGVITQRREEFRYITDSSQTFGICQPQLAGSYQLYAGPQVVNLMVRQMTQGATGDAIHEVSKLFLQTLAESGVTEDEFKACGNMYAVYGIEGVKDIICDPMLLKWMLGNLEKRPWALIDNALREECGNNSVCNHQTTSKNDHTVPQQESVLILVDINPLFLGLSPESTAIHVETLIDPACGKEPMVEVHCSTPINHGVSGADLTLSISGVHRRQGHT